MSLRAKRAALAAKVTGAPGEDAGTPPASAGTASPRVASSAPAGSPLPTAASSASVVPSSNEKLDQIAASFAPAIIGGHQAKQPPAYILEDSLGTSVYDFEKERMIAVSGKDAKDFSMLFNLPSHDIELVRRHRVIKNVGGSGGAYLLPSPADIALEEHDESLKKKSSVSPHVESSLAGFQNDWYGIDRPFKNIGVAGPLPADDLSDAIVAPNAMQTEPNSPRPDHAGLTMPDQTARMNYLFVPPSSSFIVPRVPLQQIVYETGPNADTAYIENVVVPLDDLEQTEGGNDSSDEASMSESGAETGESSDRSKGTLRHHMRDRSASEAVQVNIAALKAAAVSDSDPTDSTLLAPSDEGKRIMGVHRDLFFGQLYPLPDAPHPADVAAPDISSLGMRFKITPKDLSFQLSGVEPFFCILALFDLTSGERVSENFYFDLNNDSTLSMLPAWHEASQYNANGKPGHAKKNVEGLFWVPHASPDIWLVLRVEKVLQGDSYDSVIEPYMRTDTIKGKEREKLDSTVSSFTSRLGAFRQPFCWGMMPVFTEDKQYAMGANTVLKQLHRYKADISNAAFLEAGADVKTGSKRLKFLPGSFTFDLTPVADTTIEAACTKEQPFVDWTGRVCTPFGRTEDDDGPAAGADGAGSDEDGDAIKSKAKLLRRENRSSLSLNAKAAKLLGHSGSGANSLSSSISYVPDYYPTHEYVQQVGCFPPPAVPYTNPHNVAYVYPTQLTMSKSIGQIQARNLLIQVSLLANEDDDLKDALTAVYTPAHVNPLAKDQFSVVSYHDKSPLFYDEFKIALPTRITKNHTLRFTFYHVQCQAKGTGPTGSGSGTASALAAASASANSVLTMVGYSLFPILNNDMIPEGEITLPIVNIGDSGTASIPSGAQAGSQKTVLDIKKHSFTFRLKLSSSIYTSDKYLHPFFLEYGKLRGGAKQIKSSSKDSSSGDDAKEAAARMISLGNSMAGLIKVKPRKLLQFLPTILHQLFYIMCSQPVATSNKAFYTLIHVLHNIHQKESEMQVASVSAVLQHYTDYLFMSPPNVAPLTEGGGVTFQDTKAAPSIVNTLHTHIIRAWFTQIVETAKTDHEKLHRFSWFYFKLIYLSACAYTIDVSPTTLKDAPNVAEVNEMATNSLLASAAIGTTSPLTATPETSPSKAESATSPRADSDDVKDSKDRISRFDMDYKVALKKLVLLLAWEVQERLNASLHQAKDLSRRIAAFLVDMLSLADRGFIIDLTVKAVKEIAPREDDLCWELRTDFWRILASYEHWPQLSLPTTLHVDSKNIGNITELLAQKHYMQGALLKDVLAPMTDKTSRLRALHILQSLFLKADCDPRLNPALMSSVRLSQDGNEPVVSNQPPIEFEELHSSSSASISSSGTDSKKSRGSSRSRRASTLRSRRAALQQMALSDPTTSALKTQYLQGYFPLLLRGVDQIDALKRADFDEQRVFLSCWIYLLKNVDVRLLRQWWKSDSFTRNSAFLQTLALCAQVFENQGFSTLIEKLNHTSEVSRAIATKALIEELYSGGGIAASSMSLRQKRLETLKAKNAGSSTNVPGIAVPPTGSSPGTPEPPGSARGTLTASGSVVASTMRESMTDILSAKSPATGRKKRGKDAKDNKVWRHPGLDLERGRYDSNPTRESRISQEVAMVILDILEYYMIAKETELNANTHSNVLMESAVGALMALLSRRQGIDLQILILRVLTDFAHRFARPLFVLATSYVSQFTPRVLALCNYENERVRMGASAFFFLMMKLNLENSSGKHKNFTRVKVQTIIALSKLVASKTGIRDPSFLNRALNGVKAYSEQYDAALTDKKASQDESALLVQQVTQLSERLRSILEGSVKIQQHSGDRDMLTDLYHSIASSYRTAPDLRVTWLESLAELHARNDAWAEAGQCLVHIAALIAEYLHILEPQEGSMRGAAAFENACSSAVEEQSMLDAKTIMDGDDGVSETHIFTEKGLIDVVERAIAYLTKAQLYESAHELYKLLLPVHEKNHDYPKLAASHAALSNIFNKIIETMTNQSRLFGSYYRVGFYGTKFAELNGKEYIYKEPKITRLGEIQERLLKLYSGKLGTTITVITTSGEVEAAKAKSDAAYMQLTSVTPYFEDWELKERKTDYELSNNINRFIFETPFVKGSTKSQSPSLADQWKRKIIISVESTFPYMKRRLPVTAKDTVELSPIETAIETIKGRVDTMRGQLLHPNAKTLPLVLQGAVRVSVNSGPTEIANVFLGKDAEKSYGAAKCDMLRMVFQDFLEVCQDALAKNKEIISSAQLSLHQELEEGFVATKAILDPLIGNA